jgi:hypothetical protein
MFRRPANQLKTLPVGVAVLSGSIRGVFSVWHQDKLLNLCSMLLVVSFRNSLDAPCGDLAKWSFEDIELLGNGIVFILSSPNRPFERLAMKMCRVSSHEGFSSKWVLTSFDKLHHNEFCSATSSVLRTARTVSTNEFQGFLNSTATVFERKKGSNRHRPHLHSRCMDGTDFYARSVEFDSRFSERGITILSCHSVHAHPNRRLKRRRIPQR